MLSPNRPYLGFGLGLRPAHYDAILSERPNLDWLEIITENYLIAGGKHLHYLDQIRAHYPIVMHGVSLSIGSYDGLDNDYLKQVKALAQRIEPAWISDHLCWTGVNGINTHDLLPLPYTQEALNHVVAQIKQVQDILNRQILIENVTSYLTYQQSVMTEWEFLTEVAKQADCYLLLDINNIYVSAVNHEFNPLDYLSKLPSERIHQIHLAGHSKKDNYLIDTHDAPISAPVWDLYAETVKQMGMISTMVERDDNIPPLADLLAEVDNARSIASHIIKGKNVA